MSPRILTLLAVMVLFSGVAMAQEELNFQRDRAGAKTDPDSRDTQYIAPATTAEERATDAAARDKYGAGVEPQHEVIYRPSHGVMVPHDVYVIPPGPEEREETGQ
jgi:hypothetical protein